MLRIRKDTWRGMILLVLCWNLLAISANAEKPARVTATQLQAQLNEGSGLWLIDVRNEAEYRAAHIEGAINIPAETLLFKRLPAKKQVVLVDNRLNDVAAKAAADALLAAGQQRVAVLEGGVAGWHRAGLAVVGRDVAWRLAELGKDDIPTLAIEEKSRVVYDLRDADERQLAPLQATAKVFTGKSLDARLGSLVQVLGTPAVQQPAPVPGGQGQVVLVLPLKADAREVFLKNLWHRPEDIRILAGFWIPRIDNTSQKTVSDGGGCPSCPAR